MSLRAHVFEELARHGIEPGADPPERLKDRLHEAYLGEVRTLRDRRRRGELEGPEFARAAARLKQRYPLLALPSRLWTE